MRRSTFAIFVLVLAACSPATEPRSQPRSPAVASSGEAEPRPEIMVEPRRVIPLGDVIPDGLVRPWAMTVSRGGLICIPDMNGGRVVVIDSRLEFVGTFGTHGQGPDELSQPVACLATVSGVLVVEARYTQTRAH